MYINIKKLLNISPYNIGFNKDNIFLVNKKSKKIFCISANDFHTKWEISKENYGFIILGNKIISHNFFIYNFNGNLVYENTNINEWYNLELFDCRYDFVIYKTVDEEKEKVFYHIFDAENKILVKQNVDFFAPKLFISKSVLFCQENTHKIYIYNYNIGRILWQKDIREITQYTEWDNSEVKGEIREIYSYKDSIIVLTQVFVLRINPHTGEIIYSLRLPAGLMTLSIETEKAYGCYGYHYMEIDLEKGELINFIRIEDAIYEGKSYNATMNKATFHNGYVFHGLRLEGGQYAVGAINTQTGKREWLSLLRVNMVDKIQFHQDKMFVSDSGGNLFVYEKI